MPKRKPLPDPRWADELDRCLRCDYDLAGLTPGGVCPECGLASDAPFLILAGVPRDVSTRPAWRKWAWLALIIGVYIAANPMLVFMQIGLTAYLAFALMVAGATIAMILTSRGDRAGSCEVVFSLAGFSLRSLRLGASLDSGRMHAWIGDEQIRVRPVGSVWAKMDITSASRRGRVLRAGVRVPTDQIARVTETIQQMVAQSSVRGVDLPS